MTVRGSRGSSVAGRGAALVGAWLSAVGLGSACYEAGEGPDPQFILPFALSIAATAAVAWVVGGHPKRTLAFLLGLAGFGIGLIALALAVFWGFGDEVRVRLGVPRPDYAEFWGDLFGVISPRYFQPPGSPIRFRLIGNGEMFRARMAQLGRDAIGLAAVVSLPVGLFVGGLMVLSRRKPRLAGACALGFLLAVGTLTPSFMSALTAWILDWRSEGGLWKAASMSQGELATMLGTVMGAVVGAILVGLDARIVLERTSGQPRSVAAPSPN